MPTVSVTRQVAMPADEAWARIGGFYDIHTWHPALASVESGPEPGQRSVTMANGHQLTERLVGEGPFWQTYEPVDDPLMRGYRATIRVRPAGPAACVIEWTGEFTADDASATEFADAIRAFYHLGLESL